MTENEHPKCKCIEEDYSNPIQMFMVPATCRRIVKWSDSVHISVTDMWLLMKSAILIMAHGSCIWRKIRSLQQKWTSHGLSLNSAAAHTLLNAKYNIKKNVDRKMEESDDTGGGGGVWCCWLAWAGRPWVWGLPGAGGLALMLHVSVWWYTAYPHHHLCIRTWSLGRVEFCSFKKKEKKLQNIFLPQFAKVSESAILNYHELFFHMNVQPLSCSSATNQKCLTVLQFSHKSKVLLCLIWCCSE